MGHLHVKKILRVSLAVLGTNSFGVKPETKPTVELVVTASGPRMEETTSPAPDRSQPKHFATTGETYDNPPLDLEADDKGTSVLGSESHRDPATHVSQELPQCASSSQLPRFRIYGERDAAVKIERSVKLRIELLDEDEFFVSSQQQSFREQVSRTCQRSW